MHKSPLFAMLLLAGCDDDGQSACENAVNTAIGRRTGERIAKMVAEKQDSTIIFGYTFYIENSQSDGNDKSYKIICVYDKDDRTLNIETKI